MCYLKEPRPLTGTGSTTMNCHAKRVARSCHVSTFAALLLIVANLAYAAAPDLSFTPATLNLKYQVGSALPAAQSVIAHTSAPNLPPL